MSTSSISRTGDIYGMIGTLFGVTGPMMQSVHYNVHVRNRSKSRVLSDSLCNFDISRSENAIPVIKINFGLTDQKIQSMLR